MIHAPETKLLEIIKQYKRVLLRKLPNSERKMILDTLNIRRKDLKEATPSLLHHKVCLIEDCIKNQLTQQRKSQHHHGLTELLNHIQIVTQEYEPHGQYITSTSEQQGSYFVKAVQLLARNEYTPQHQAEIRLMSQFIAQFECKKIKNNYMNLLKKYQASQPQFFFSIVKQYQQSLSMK